MEYYVAKDGEKVGPLTQFRISAMLREGELSPDDKGWHRDLENWLPISEIPSLKSFVESLQEEKAKEDAEAIAELENAAAADNQPRRIPVAIEVRPLIRFWARSFDYLIVLLLVMLFSDVEFSFSFSFQDLSKSLASSEPGAEIMRYSLALWHVVEGLMIAVVGTTPGKALFGIRVTTLSGSKASIIIGILRSFLVYILGVALFYLYLLSILAMTFAFFRLMATGSTLWDSALRLDVKHPPLTKVRILLAIGAFITLMLMQNLNSFL